MARVMSVHAQGEAWRPTGRATSFVPSPVNLLRRACACGGTPGADGECAACRAQRLARRAQPAAIAPATGDESLLELRPLATATNGEPTPGYGHAFGRLRIHADPRAAAGSASAGRVTRTAVGPCLQRQSSSSGGAITDPLAYAQNLETNYPGWRSALPDCPCTDAEARGHPEMWAGGIGGCPDFFHPGAATGYRSKHGYTSVPGTSHGQQCCYDTQGRLITDGPGAGTPDIWSPESDFLKHQIYDVQTWLRLGWATYNRYWIPNRGSNCPANRVERPTARCEPRYLGFGDYLGEDCIVRPGPGPKI
jgi:hypothetical protein